MAGLPLEPPTRERARRAGQARPAAYQEARAVRPRQRHHRRPPPRPRRRQAPPDPPAPRASRPRAVPPGRRPGGHRRPADPSHRLLRLPRAPPAPGRPSPRQCRCRPGRRHGPGRRATPRSGSRGPSVPASGTTAALHRGRADGGPGAIRPRRGWRVRLVRRGRQRNVRRLAPGRHTGHGVRAELGGGREPRRQVGPQPCCVLVKQPCREPGEEVRHRWSPARRNAAGGEMTLPRSRPPTSGRPGQAGRHRPRAGCSSPQVPPTGTAPRRSPPPSHARS